MTMINKDTALYFSISSSPGNFGATLYNKAFEWHGINAIYKPLQVERDQFFTTLSALKMIGVKGVSVSMPFKFEAVLNCVNMSTCNNVNTLVMPKGWTLFQGFNTDGYGFLNACRDILPLVKSATILGKGAVSQTIQQVLKQYGIAFHVRSTDDLIHDLPEGDLLINATPVGMNHPDYIWPPSAIEKFKYVFDVVVRRDTRLLQVAKQMGKETIPGYKMAYYQFEQQFFHYIGFKPQKELMMQLMKEMGYEF